MGLNDDRAVAYAKVNLCLFVGPTRSDGRHELVTLFESAGPEDELVITSLASGPDEVVCPGVAGENLVAAALAALRESGWDAPPVRVEITKRIPVAAGLGGGSADAAAVLRYAERIAPVAVVEAGGDRRPARGRRAQPADAGAEHRDRSGGDRRARPQPRATTTC